LRYSSHGRLFKRLRRRFCAAQSHDNVDVESVDPVVVIAAV
jgi:hypothetical protein